MLQMRVRKALFGLAVASATALGAAPTHAITVGATWDPRYGSPFVGTGSAPDMWWSGQGEIFIPNTCVVPTGTAVVTSTSCAGMLVQNAFIYLRAGESASPFATLDFSANTVQINAASFIGGQLVGVDSNYFESWQSTDATQYNVDDYRFTFGFTYDGALLFHADTDAVGRHATAGHSDAERFWNGVGKGHLTDSCLDPNNIAVSTTACGFSQEVATVEFAVTVVPEPQTYALMLAGLAVVGFVARRRRQS